MKLAFTTLGCPEWDLDTIISKGKQYGFQGVDFRGYQGEMNIYKLPEFSARAEETRERFQAENLEVSCFSSSVKLVSKDNFLQNRNEIEQYAKLCRLFHTRFIRVFGGSIGEMDRAEAAATAAAHLRQFAEIVNDDDIRIVLETHDDWTACEDVKAVMDQVGDSHAGVLWDVHHPYRMLGEQPETTWSVLGDRIAYTHWKDSRTVQDDPGYCYGFMGEGDIPLRSIHTLCKQKGYDGWFTFEWEKKWHPELAEPEEAFPQFVQYMQSLES